MTETPAALRDEAESVHAWRAAQLIRLGVAPATAAEVADEIDWHALAALLAQGCTVDLALEILR
jgi:hypothetical protein